MPAPRPGLLEVGRIARAHGLTGEVIVDLGSNHPERTRAGTTFVTGSGDLVLATARPHGGRWLMSFDGYRTREAAEELRGLLLWAEPVADDTVLWVHELIGCEVVDQHGKGRGTVVAVLDNPAADILELDSGALVPVNFVTEGPSGSSVRVDVPEGLFDI